MLMPTYTYARHVQARPRLVAKQKKERVRCRWLDMHGLGFRRVRVHRLQEKAVKEKYRSRARARMQVHS